MKKIAIISILSVICIGILYLIYRIGTTGFTNPPCSEIEIELNIPENIIGKTIVFEKPIMGIISKEREEIQRKWNRDCSPSILQSIGNIIPIDSNVEINLTSLGNYYLFEFRKNEKFKIIKHVYVSCRSLACIDSGGPGDIYLLQNEKSEIWQIRAMTFSNTDRDYKIKPWRAGYYDKVDQRIGDVIINVITCHTSFSGVISNCRDSNY